MCVMKIILMCVLILMWNDINVLMCVILLLY